MAAMDIGVQLRLLDQFSQPMQQAAERLNRFKSVMGSVSGEAGRAAAGINRMAAAYSNLSVMADRASAKLSAMKVKALGVVLGAAGMAAPFKIGADWELGLTRLLQIQGTKAANFPKALLEADRFLSGKARASNSTGSGLLEALTTMQSLGIEAEAARASIEAIGRASVATGADANELAKTFQTAWQHLGLQPGDTERFFSSMHQAGKMGGFELKDMARFFPAAFANLGNLYGNYMKTLPDDAARSAFALKKASEVASWAQFIRLGAADAQTAGTNMMNIYQKNFVEETSKNFEKHLGVDFRKNLGAHVAKGGDPVEWVTWQLAEHIKKKGMNPLYIGQLFADKQAMEGYIPLVAAYMQKWGKLAEFHKAVRDAADQGIISQDYATTINTVSKAFERFTESLNQVFKAITLYGGRESLVFGFDLLAGGLNRLSDAIRDNPALSSSLVRIGMGIGALFGGLTLARFAGAGASFLFARTGMGLIGILSAIPGLGAALGGLGATLGWIGRLGLLGGAGFLAWQQWPAIVEAMQVPLDYLRGPLSYVGDVLGRLGQLFPGLKASTEGWGDSIRNLLPSMEQLRQIGADLKNGFSWLFTGEGDKAGFSKAAEGIFGTNAGKGLNDWWQKQKDVLTGGEGIWAAVKGWSKAIGTGFLAGAGAMTARHGINGLILSLMAARTALFAVTSVLAALGAAFSFIGIFAAPLFQAALDRMTVRHWRLVGGGIMALVGALYTFGLSGSLKLLKGFSDGLGSSAGGAWSSVKASFSRLWTSVFGEAMDELHFAGWIDDLRGRMWLLGETIGGYFKPVLNGVARAFDRIREAVESWKAWDPENSFLRIFRFDNVTDWVGKIMAATAALFIFAGAARAAWVAIRFMSMSLLTLSGIPLFLKLISGTGAAVGGLMAGGALANLLNVFRAGGIGGVLARGALIGTGPIGWFLLLAGVIGLAVENMDALKARFEILNKLTPAWWLGKLFGMMDRKPGEPPPPTAPMDPYMLPPGFHHQNFSAIDNAGQAAGNKITDAGANAANALNAVAEVLSSLVKRIEAAVGAGALGPSVDGALSDQGRI